MQPGPTAGRSIADYGEFTPAPHRERVRSVGAELGGVRVLHVNSTASGGGVAELLRSLVPLSNEAGCPTDWRVMEAEPAFFDVTKALHNGLQGKDVTLDPEMRETYLRWTDRNAAALTEAYDVVVLHDPQSLAMIDPLADRYPETTFVWRCHIDPTDAAPGLLEFLGEYVGRVDRVVVSRPEYADAFGVDATTIHPSIDPLSSKNRELTADESAAAATDLGDVDLDAPLVAQVSRFDPWKDPVGVVEAYRRVRDDHPEARLVLAGGMPDDDPEGEAVFERVADAADGDPGVALLTDLSDEAVNLLQRRADVVVQKSLREGFALTVSEALWKRTPVVGAAVGGIPLQIEDGTNGYLVAPEDVPATADRIGRLLAGPAHAGALGEQGRTTVRERFLLPRHLLDWLELVADLR